MMSLLFCCVSTLYVMYVDIRTDDDDEFSSRKNVDLNVVGLFGSCY